MSVSTRVKDKASTLGIETLIFIPDALYLGVDESLAENK